MSRLPEVIASYESEQFSKETEKGFSLEEEREYEERLEKFNVLASDKILGMIDEMKIHPIEKEMNEKTFNRDFLERQCVIDKFEYLINYMEAMWMMQERRQDKKLGRKNKKIIRRLARSFEEWLGGKWFSFC